MPIHILYTVHMYLHKGGLILKQKLGHVCGNVLYIITDFSKRLKNYLLPILPAMKNSLRLRWLITEEPSSFTLKNYLKWSKYC